jgi:hypothetical protein
MTNVVEFSRFKRTSGTNLIEGNNVCAHLVPTDPDLDKRAKELLPAARETLAMFGGQPEAIADLLVYAAARLERVGFEMFPGFAR